MTPLGCYMEKKQAEHLWTSLLKGAALVCELAEALKAESVWVSGSHVEPLTTDFPPATARCSLGKASRSWLASFSPPAVSTADKQA